MLVGQCEQEKPKDFTKLLSAQATSTRGGDPSAGGDVSPSPFFAIKRPLLLLVS